MIRLRIIFFLTTYLLIQNFIYSQEYFKTDRLSANTRQYSEIAPAFYHKGLVFSSNRKDDMLINTKSADNNYLYNLYQIQSKGGKRWNTASKLSKTINSRYDEGAASFDSSFTIMYFTRTKDVSKAIGDKISADSTHGIFIAEFANGEWTNIRPFEYNKEFYNTGFPFLSLDGQTLFYCSDEPGGLGGYDIYVCKKENNTWQTPEHLGPVINSPEHDVFPFYHSGNRLYFSSRGHKGFGGLDIFYSDFIDGTWKEPVDMPDPFNSEFDDFGLVLNETMDTGYFSSNRQGTDDIYKIYTTLPTFTECRPQEENDYCYIFYETGSLNLDTTSLKYEWDLGDGAKVRDMEANHCFAGPGFYKISLNVIDTLTGDIYFSEASYDLNIEDIEQPYITAPDTGFVNEKIQFDGLKSNLKDFNIEQYVWDFNDGTWADDSLVFHSFTKPGEYFIKLGLISETTGRREKPKKECVTRKIVVLDTRENQ
ncbi:MAG: PKD domain-containing protein [Bacteroidales bacterium]|nr:PKD domain-containing protein [Bacteroidales bacterium]